MGYTHTIFSTPKLHEVKHSLEKKAQLWKHMEMLNNPLDCMNLVQHNAYMTIFGSLYSYGVNYRQPTSWN